MEGHREGAWSGLDAQRHGVERESAGRVKGSQMVKSQLLTHLPMGGGGLLNVKNESIFS